MGSGSGRVVAGVIVVAIGVGFLLDTAGVIDFGDLISDWWPLIIVAVGVAQLATRSGAPVGGLVVIATGLALLAWTLGYLPRNIWSYFWPVVIIAVGLAILLGMGSGRGGSTARGWGASQTTGEAEFERSATFGSSETRAESQTFRGARLNATFGGLRLDLRGAKVAPDGATVTANATFGGIEILVPADWRVRVDGSGLLGGFESRAPAPAEGQAPALVVRGSATFGGVEVKT